MNEWLAKWTPACVAAAQQLQPIWSQPAEKVVRFEDSFERSRVRFEGLLNELALEIPQEVKA
jgi:propane monooxygenase small subunit